MHGLADVMSATTYIYSVHLAAWYHIKAGILKTICALNIDIRLAYLIYGKHRIKFFGDMINQGGWCNYFDSSPISHDVHQ